MEKYASNSVHYLTVLISLSCLTHRVSGDSISNARGHIALESFRVRQLIVHLSISRLRTVRLNSSVRHLSDWVVCKADACSSCLCVPLNGVLPQAKN